MPEKQKAIFRKLTVHFGSIETIYHMKQMTKNERAIASLDRLCAFYEVMCDYGKEEYISFDLGMLSRFHYYTGVIFRAYTYGTGDVIAAGGRYDKLVAQFGKEAPAIGIAVYADQIMNALMRQGLQKEPEADGCLLVYLREQRKKAVLLADRYRAEGKKVTLMEKGAREVAELSEYAKRNGISEIVECD